MGLSIALSMIVPLVLIGFLLISVGIGEKGAPALIYLAFAGFGCIMTVMALSSLASSRVQLTIDRRRSALIIESRSVRSELRMRDVSNAEISIRSGSAGSSTIKTSYRLEFVLRDGKRVPATSSFYNHYLMSDLDEVLKIINSELLGATGAEIAN
jgi:hypothetical protein